MERPDAVSRRADLVQPYGTQHVEAVTPRAELSDPLSRRGNRMSWPGLHLVVRRVIADFSVDDMVDRAASLTYYTVLAIAPMILAIYSLVLLLLPRDGGEAPLLLNDLVKNYVPEALQSEALALLATIVGSPSDSTIALVISIAVSLLSASAYVRSFSRNANVIYGREEGRTFAMTWLTMWLVTVAMSLGVLLLLVGLVARESIFTGVVAPLARPFGLEEEVENLVRVFLPVWDWLRYPVVALLSLGMLSMLYQVTPNVRRGAYRPVTYGAFLAFVVSAIIWIGFSWYVTEIGVQSAYGAFGTVLMVLVLVWIMNIVLVVGVKIDAEVLRVKELQIGYPSEDVIQAPPKSNAALRIRLRTQRRIGEIAEKVKNRRRKIL
ncbi:YihY/virulence factor BrkB family protein [Corynebacterium timonense]|uniref:Membrane protein n=1 Tax=Corynebacterium timonense TaxID=441500 RepID=A0A1H1QVG3_9CORY|nr:YihY/virulence factor BrkB family protein [Corynebacterium timonense]SDS26849.1 membrane protein [Corynebacterium timonense]